MYTVLLSGGSGKRLWPLSNDLRSKQYIRMIDSPDNSGERVSMVQRVVLQLNSAGFDNCIICTSASQTEIIKSQLGSINVAIEPERRDTFPCISLSCSYLKSELGADDNDVVTVLPVDVYAGSTYFKTLKSLCHILQSENADIALMGAKPNAPSTKFGYIIPEKYDSSYFKVKTFTEKPDIETAKKLISQGAVFNCGVLCFRIGYVLNILKQYINDISYKNVFENYTLLPKISFDYAVLEKAENIVCAPFSGMWEDLGSWSSLTKQMSGNTTGNAIIDDSCQNTHIINELKIPVVATGTTDMVIAATTDGILIGNKSASDNIKDILKDHILPPMFEERRWGTITTIPLGDENIRKITLFAGMNSSCHYHTKRDEVWTVLHGSGILIIDNTKLQLAKGVCVTIPRNTDHMVKAFTELEFLEVHIGSSISSDIHRHTFDWESVYNNTNKSLRRAQ